MVEPILYRLGGAFTIICTIFGALSNKRTEYGQKALEETIGYRVYLEEKIELREGSPMFDGAGSGVGGGGGGSW